MSQIIWNLYFSVIQAIQAAAAFLGTCTWPAPDIGWFLKAGGNVGTVTDSNGTLTIPVTNGDGSPFTVNMAPVCNDGIGAEESLTINSVDIIIEINRGDPRTSIRGVECDVSGVSVSPSDPAYTGNIRVNDGQFRDWVTAGFIPSLTSLDRATFTLLLSGNLWWTDRIIDPPNQREKFVGQVASDLFSNLGALDSGKNGFLQCLHNNNSTPVGKAPNWPSNGFTGSDCLCFNSANRLNRVSIQSNSSNVLYFGSTTPTQITQIITFAVGGTPQVNFIYQLNAVDPNGNAISQPNCAGLDNDSNAAIAARLAAAWNADGNANQWATATSAPPASSGQPATVTITRFPCTSISQIGVTADAPGAGATLTKASTQAASFTGATLLGGIFDIGAENFVAMPGGIRSRVSLWPGQVKPASVQGWYSGASQTVASSNADRTPGAALIPAQTVTVPEYDDNTPPDCGKPAQAFPSSTSFDYAIDPNGDSCSCSNLQSGRHVNPYGPCSINFLQAALANFAGQYYDRGYPGTFYTGTGKVIQNAGAAGLLTAASSKTNVMGCKVSATGNGDGTASISGYGGGDGPVYLSLASVGNISDQGFSINSLTASGGQPSIVDGQLTNIPGAPTGPMQGWAAAGWRKFTDRRIRYLYPKKIWIADANGSGGIWAASPTLVNYAVDGSAGRGTWVKLNASTQYMGVDLFGVVNETNGTPAIGDKALYVGDNTADGFTISSNQVSFDDGDPTDPRNPFFAKARRGTATASIQAALAGQMSGQATIVNSYSLRDRTKDWSSDAINTGTAHIYAGTATGGGNALLVDSTVTSGAKLAWWGGFANLTPWQDSTVEVSQGGFPTGTVTIASDGTATVTAQTSTFLIGDPGMGGTTFSFRIGLGDGTNGPGIAFAFTGTLTAAQVASGVATAWTGNSITSLYATAEADGAAIVFTATVEGEPLFINATTSGGGAVSLVAGGPSPCTGWFKALVTGGMVGTLQLCGGGTINSGDGYLIREPLFEDSKWQGRTLAALQTSTGGTAAPVEIIGNDRDTIFVAAGFAATLSTQAINAGNQTLTYSIDEISTGTIVQLTQSGWARSSGVPTQVQSNGMCAMDDVFGQYLFDDLLAVANALNRTLGSGGFGGVIPAGTPFSAFDSSGPEPYDEGVTNCSTEWPYMWENFWVPHLIVLSSDGTDVGSPGMEIDYSFQPNPSDGYVCGGANDECSFEAEGVAGVGVFVPTSGACPNVAVSLTPWILTGLPPGGGSPYVPTYNAPPPFTQNQYVDIGTVGAQGGQNGQPIGPVGSLDYLIEMQMPPYIPGCNTFISLGYGVDDIVVVVDR